MWDRSPTIALNIVLIVLTGGLGGLAWVALQQHEALGERTEENQQLRSDLAATQRTVEELEQRVAAALMLAADQPLANRVRSLEDSVGDKPFGYRSRAPVWFNAGIWDELDGVGRDLDDLQQCVDSIVSVIQFNHSFVFC